MPDGSPTRLPKCTQAPKLLFLVLLWYAVQFAFILFQWSVMTSFRAGQQSRFKFSVELQYLNVLAEHLGAYDIPEDMFYAISYVFMVHVACCTGSWIPQTAGGTVSGRRTIPDFLWTIKMLITWRTHISTQWFKLAQWVLLTVPLFLLALDHLLFLLALDHLPGWFSMAAWTLCTATALLACWP